MKLWAGLGVLALIYTVVGLAVLSLLFDDWDWGMVLTALLNAGFILGLFALIALFVYWVDWIKKGAR